MEALRGVLREFLCLRSKQGKDGLARFYLNDSKLMGASKAAGCGGELKMLNTHIHMCDAETGSKLSYIYKLQETVVCSFLLRGQRIR